MKGYGTESALYFGDSERYSTFIIKKTKCFVFLLYSKIFVRFELDCKVFSTGCSAVGM